MTIVLGIFIGIGAFLMLHFIITDWWENLSRAGFIKLLAGIAFAGFLLYSYATKAETCYSNCMVDGAGNEHCITTCYN